jgi:glycosyltransferase involved in cell wall biosynthesis
VSEGRRPRLLVIASTFPAKPGDGTPPFVRNLSEYEAREFETLVLVPRVPGAPATERLGPLTVRRFRYFPRRWEDLAAGAILENVRAHRGRMVQVPALFLAEWWALRRAVREFDPDVLHVHWLVPQGMVALLAARDRPWVLTTLGGDVYALGGAAWRRAKSAVVRQANAVTTMNADMAARLVALGAAPDRVQVMPMGVDVERVRKAAAGEQREPHRLVFAGRLVEKKGAAVLLDALAELDGVDWRLDLVGDGPLRAELARSAAALGDRVTFRGQLTSEELARTMARASIVVVPSVPAASGDQDGLPVVLLEAMTLGCAVIASALPGLDEALTDGETGVLVPAGDAGALRKALRELLGDPDRRERLGRAAAEASAYYTSDAVGERYVALLRDAIARHRRR